MIKISNNASQSLAYERSRVFIAVRRSVMT